MKPGRTYVESTYSLLITAIKSSTKALPASVSSQTVSHSNMIHRSSIPGRFQRMHVTFFFFFVLLLSSLDIQVFRLLQATNRYPFYFTKLALSSILFIILWKLQSLACFEYKFQLYGINLLRDAILIRDVSRLCPVFFLKR